jgi:ATP synthase protein I
LATTKKQKSKYDLDGWNYAPTKAEQARWQREWEKGEAIAASKNPVYAKSKFSTRQMKKLRPKDLKPTVAGRELTEVEKAERRRVADDAYLKVKQNLLLTTAGLCGSGTVGAFVVGGVPLGASFAFGSAGGVVLRQAPEQQSRERRRRARRTAEHLGSRDPVHGA